MNIKWNQILFYLGLLAFSSHANNPPTSADNNLNLSWYSSYAFQLSDFPFTDDFSPNWTYVKIASLPTLGTLFYNANVIQVGDSIPQTAIANLSYSASSGSIDGFSFYVKDDIQWSVSPSNMNITLSSPPNPQPQSIIRVPIGTLQYGDVIKMQHTATSGLTVQAQSYTPSICQVFGGDSLKALSLGTCLVQLQQYGNGLYYAAPMDYDTIQISPRNIYFNNPNGISKVYDGTKVVPLTGIQVMGILPNDTVNITMGTFEFVDSTAGMEKAIQVVGSSFSGPQMGNYTLADPMTIYGDINPKSLQVKADAKSKIYGQADPTLTWSATGYVSGESYNGNLDLYRVNGETVGQYEILLGEQRYIPNYSVQFTADTLTITPLSLAISGMTVLDKEYDGSRLAQVNGGSLMGLIGIDTVDFVFDSAQFNDASVGTNKLVQLMGLRLEGPQAMNYTVVSPTGLMGTINSVAQVQTIQWTTSLPSSLAYGNNPGGILAQNAHASSTLPIVFSTLSPSVCVYEPTFGKIRTLDTGICIIRSEQSGDQNWLPVIELDTVYISQRSMELGITGLVVQDKIYDGTTTAIVTGGNLIGVLPGDTVFFSLGSMNFASAAVGNNIAVNGGFVVNGPQANKYLGHNLSGLLGNILPAKSSQTISLVTPDSVMYGAPGMILPGSASSGLPIYYLSKTPQTCGFGPEANKLNFKAAGNCQIEATQNGNVSFFAADTVRKSIFVKRAVLNLLNVIGTQKEYDQTRTASLSGGSLNGVMGNDTVFYTLGVANFADSLVGSQKQILIVGTTLNGPQSANYTFPSPFLLQGSILPKLLSLVNLSIQDKFYNGSVGASVIGGNLIGILPGENVSFSLDSAVYANPYPEMNKPASLRGLHLTGTHASNYSINSPTGLTGNILSSSSSISLSSSSYTIPIQVSNPILISAASFNEWGMDGGATHGNIAHEVAFFPESDWRASGTSLVLDTNGSVIGQCAATNTQCISNWNLQHTKTGASIRSKMDIQAWVPGSAQNFGWAYAGWTLIPNVDQTINSSSVLDKARPFALDINGLIEFDLSYTMGKNLVIEFGEMGVDYSTGLITPASIHYTGKGQRDTIVLPVNSAQRESWSIQSPFIAANVNSISIYRKLGATTTGASFPSMEMVATDMEFWSAKLPTNQISSVNRNPIKIQPYGPYGLAVNFAPITEKLSTKYSDPDGDALGYILESTPAFVQATIMNDTLNIVALGQLTGTGVLVLKITDAKGGVLLDTLSIVVGNTQNQAPQFVQAPNLSYLVDFSEVKMPMSSYVNDLENDPLSYTVTSTTGKITAIILDDTLRINSLPGMIGVDTLVVKAFDQHPTPAVAYWIVHIDPILNRNPVESSNFGPLTYIQNFGPQFYDLKQYYRDPDGDGLGFWIHKQASNIQLTMQNDTLSVHSLIGRSGMDTLILKVVDSKGGVLFDTILVNVIPKTNSNPILTRNLNIAPLNQNFATLLVPLNSYFTDPDADPLKFNILNSKGIVNSSVSGDTLKVSYNQNVGVDTLRLEVSDGVGGVIIYPLAIQVSNSMANQAPTFVVLNPVVNQVEALNPGDGLRVISNWATQISTGELHQPFRFEIQPVDPVVIQLAGGLTTLFKSPPQVDTLGTLRFELNPNVYTYAGRSFDFNIRIRDQGGIQNGGVDTSAWKRFYIQIEGINQAPIANRNDLDTLFSINPGGSEEILNWLPILSVGNSFEDKDPMQGNLSVRILGADTADFAKLPVVDLVKQTISFQVKSGRSGLRSLTLLIKDQGGTQNGGVDSLRLPFVFSIKSNSTNLVNSEPVIQSIGPNDLPYLILAQGWEYTTDLAIAPRKAFGEIYMWDQTRNLYVRNITDPTKLPSPWKRVDWSPSVQLRPLVWINGSALSINWLDRNTTTLNNAYVELNVLDSLGQIEKTLKKLNQSSWFWNYVPVGKHRVQAKLFATQGQILATIDTTIEVSGDLFVKNYPPTTSGISSWIMTSMGDSVPQGKSWQHWDPNATLDPLRSRYREYTAVSHINPAWGAWINLDQGARMDYTMESLKDSVVLELSAENEGWNQVANPYPFELGQNAVKNGDGLTCWQWDRIKSDYVQKENPGAFEACWINVTTNRILTFYPIPNLIPMKTTATSARSDYSGLIEMNLKAGSYQDSGNIFGLTQELTMAEIPSPVDGRIRVSFVNQGREYQKLARTERKNIWNIKLQSGVSGLSQGTLSFNGLSDIEKYGQALYFRMGDASWRRVDSQFLVPLSRQGVDAELQITTAKEIPSLMNHYEFVLGSQLFSLQLSEEDKPLYLEIFTMNGSLLERITLQDLRRLNRLELLLNGAYSMRLIGVKGTKGTPSIQIFN